MFSAFKVSEEMMDAMEMKVRMDHGRVTWNLEGVIRLLKANLERPTGPGKHAKSILQAKHPHLRDGIVL